MLCHGKHFQTILTQGIDNRFGKPGKYDVKQCVHCGLAETYPRMTEKEILTYYDDYFLQDSEPSDVGVDGDIHSTAMYDVFGKLGLVKIWHYINGNPRIADLPLQGKILDVGSGRGAELGILRNSRPEITEFYGIEPNAEAVEIARNKGFNIVQGTLFDAKFPKDFFDGILVSHVIEHIIDPKEILAEIHRVMKKGGKLCIYCPNIQALNRILFGKHWINWHLPFHRYHYSRKALIRLLEENGFQVVSMQTYTPGEWVLSSMQIRQNAKTGNTRLGRINSPDFVKRFFLAIIMRPVDIIGRGDALRAVAVKV